MVELYVFTIKNEKVKKALEKHTTRKEFAKPVSFNEVRDLAINESKLGKFLEKFLLKHINEL